MNRRILTFLLLLLVMIEDRQTAPTASPNSNTTVAVFKVQAQHEIYSVLAEIHELEAYVVRYCVT